jgi:TonB family protein
LLQAFPLKRNGKLFVILLKVSVLRSRKILILSLFFSFVCHTAVLSLTTYMEMNGPASNNIREKTVKVINVNLHEAPLPPEKVQVPEIKKRTVAAIKKTVEETAVANESYPEDTVDLDARHTTYTPYLTRIKRKIDYAWRYPRQAYAAGEEGITVVKFSIDQTGMLVAGNITTSSGSKLLDRGVLEAVQSAAPYGPLPDNIKLSKLHIIATFHYKLSK